MSNVINMAAHIDRRDNEFWDNQARRLGYPDYAALSADADAAFDEAWDRQVQNCTHADKNHQLGMCESCAEAVEL